MNEGLNRGRLALLARVALVVGLGAAAGAQAGQPPAAQLSEQVFKNVQVLKGIPVDEFMDTMGMFSAATGLNCADCHVVKDWASFADETPIKRTARRMVLMMNDINKNHFAGVTRVTCFTCHHGGQNPPSAANLAVQYAAPADDPNEIQVPPGGQAGVPSADQVFAKYMEAVGGPSHAGALRSLAITGTYNGFDTGHESVPVEIYAEAPDKRAQVVHARFGDKITVVNGGSGWISSADRPVPLMVLTRGDLEGARIDALVLFPALVRQLARTWRIGVAEIDDNDVTVAQGITPREPPVNLYFDDSGLLVRMVRFSDTAVGRVPTQIDFSDYRAVGGGVKVPFHWQTTWTDNQVTTIVKDLQVNVSIPGSRFAAPAPAAPPRN